MEVERHVRPAAEEDQGAGVVRQVPLEHFDMGFALGIKDTRHSLAGVSCSAWP